jgi:hypothetical protein
MARAYQAQPEISRGRHQPDTHQLPGRTVESAIALGHAGYILPADFGTKAQKVPSWSSYAGITSVKERPPIASCTHCHEQPPPHQVLILGH